jgi:threonine dehydratase
MAAADQAVSPTIQDVLRAARTIRPYLRPTPVISTPALDRLLGCSVFVKCEHVNPTGAFKVRGALNVLANLPPEDRRRGVIASSTGNHGQAVAYAGRVFGTRVIVGVPEGANPYKLQAMRDLGAEVIVTGRDFDEAREWVERTAVEEGFRYIHSGNEPLLIAGAGTISLELLEEVPDLNAVIVPIGGGSGASGHCIAGKAVHPGLRVIGVQSEGAPAVAHSWRERRLITTPEIKTFAEGLQTRIPFELTIGILWRDLDECILVTDREIEEAIVLMLESTHQLAEAAGAAPLAAALRLKPSLAGKRVGLILSGGNLTLDALRGIMLRVPAASAPRLHH